MLGSLNPFILPDKNFIRFERATPDNAKYRQDDWKEEVKSYVIVVSRLLGEPYLHITQRERGRRTLLTEWLHKYNSRCNATTNAFRVMLMLMT
jgi:hypothetical protein